MGDGGGWGLGQRTTVLEDSWSGLPCIKEIRIEDDSVLTAKQWFFSTGPVHSLEETQEITMTLVHLFSIEHVYGIPHNLRNA